MGLKRFKFCRQNSTKENGQEGVGNGTHPFDQSSLPRTKEGKS